LRPTSPKSGTSADTPGGAWFDGVDPGWVVDRTAHVHFKILIDDLDMLTGQTISRCRPKPMYLRQLQRLSAQGRPASLLIPAKSSDRAGCLARPASENAKLCELGGRCCPNEFVSV
jgi:hypothetical protein